MNEQFTGKIVSTQLGIFGRDEIIYGFISMQTKDNRIIKVKVDSYTTFNTLNIGDWVLIEAEFLGNTDILVARNIQPAESELHHQSDAAKAVV
jgi:hypothetical protein